MSGGHLDDVEVGEEYMGSLVTMIEQDVADGPEKYHIKRKINLADGTQMKDEYWREKSPGGKKYESKVDRLEDYNKTENNNNNDKSALRSQNKKTKYKNSKISKEKRRSDAREKAREMMASRHGKGKRVSTDSICSASSSGTISNVSSHSYIDDFY